MTSFLLADFLYYVLGSHALMKQAAIVEEAHVAENGGWLRPTASEELRPSVQQLQRMESCQPPSELESTFFPGHATAGMAHTLLAALSEARRQRAQPYHAQIPKNCKIIIVVF